VTEYYLGHSKLEMDRLTAQAEVLRPVTERLLKSAGIKPGMRVLDLGCGAGDVTMIAAELVGADGVVVGADRAAEAIDLDTKRAEHAGFENITFKVATESDANDAQRYDLIVGRYVLIHQPDPVSFIRAALARLAPGGIFALHEIDLHKKGETLPAVPSVDVYIAQIMAAMRAGIPQPDAAARLVELFLEAGASCPQIFCERPAAAGPAASMYRWIALNMAVVSALTNAEPIDADRLETQIGNEMARARSQLVAPDQCCAWVQV
jgi:ubiquinone/menaquinone biosynthesis C-methylase UbiE